MEEAEEDLIAFYLLPARALDQAALHQPAGTRQQRDRPALDVVGIFPNDASVIRLAGALLAEQNDEWLVQRRYLSVESMALILAAGRPGGESLEQQQD